MHTLFIVKKYYLMAIKLGNSNALDNLEYFYKDIDYYDTLNNIENPHQIVQNELIKLRKNK